MLQRTPYIQRGISLVSLLVSMLIGIFLVGGVVKIYADSKNSFNTRNVVAEASEEQRFAIDEMRRIVVMVGRGLHEAEAGTPSNTPFPAIAAGGIVETSDGSSGILAGTDVIAVRYRHGPSCNTYQNVPYENTPQFMTNATQDPYTDNKTCSPSQIRFFITDQDGDGARDDLVCEQITYYTRNQTTGATDCNEGTTAYPNPPQITTRTLVSNIHMMKVLYGVTDTSHLNLPSNVMHSYAERYLRASQVPDWRRVVSIRVALMAGSESSLPQPSRKSSPAAQQILGFNFMEPDTARFYKVASSTIALRNLGLTVERN